MNLQLVQTNVKTLLAEYPKLKSLENRMEAIWTYYEVFEGIVEVITKKDWLTSLTNPETISRAIRKEVNPELEKAEKERKEEIQKSFGEFYKNEKTQ
jgi:predicted DNA-binding transcriptional regulator